MRVVVGFERPLRTAADDGAAWIRAEAGKLLAVEGVASVTVTELRPAGRTLPQISDWLIEIEIDASTDPLLLTEDEAFMDLFGDLRSLSLHPAAAVADPAAAISFSRADSR